MPFDNVILYVSTVNKFVIDATTFSFDFRTLLSKGQKRKAFYVSLTTRRGRRFDVKKQTHALCSEYQ